MSEYEASSKAIAVWSVHGKALLDLAADLAEWSQATFGADSKRGPAGALKHLEKEAREAQAAPGDLTEYADCLMLLLDATRRAGFGPFDLLRAAKEKMKVNKTRNWPKPTSDDPVEHLRGTTDGQGQRAGTQDSA